MKKILMDDTALKSVAHRGLMLGDSPLLRHQRGGRREVREGVTLFSWNMPGPGFDKAAVLGPALPLARVLELGRAFFGDTPFGVVVEADAGHPVEAELRAAGWAVTEDEPVLVLPRLPPLPPPPPGLDIRRVADAAGRADFVRVVAAGFGAPTADFDSSQHAADFDSFGPPLAAALDPDVAVLVGYFEGRPVSAAMMYKVDEIAGITGVATDPAYRRRKFATALTWAAVAAGAARGCTCVALGGLGASYDMYRGMGFVHVCNHRTYVPPGGG